MEIKKEEIYLDLSKCSEYDKETVSSLVKFNLRLTFPYLVFEDEELKTWIQCKKEYDLLESRKEINFQQFCELFQDEKVRVETIKENLQGENFTREDVEKAYRAGEKGVTFYFKDTTVILPQTYEGIDG